MSAPSTVGAVAETDIVAPLAGNAPAKKNPSKRLRIVDITINLDSEY
jgi:hypothetical protein